MFDWKVKDIKATNAIFLGDKTEEEGRPFKARFLQAGLVKYDFGVCLLKKETIDRFVNTFVGCPVIINHKDDIKKDDKQGTIKSIWFAPEDGWFWCSGVLDEEAAKKVEKDGFNVSCQYRITEYSNNTENKLHNGNPYDKEILNGVFEHLAIVENPRYEDAYIAVNAIVAENADNEFITVGEGDDKHSIPIEFIEQSSKNMPKNLDINELNAVEFTQKDIDDFNGYGSVKKYYEENIQGKNITHPDDRLGKVYFDDDGIGESIKINRPKNLFIVTKAMELVKQGKYDRVEELNHKRNDGVIKFHIIYTKAKLPRKTRILQIKIAEKENGKKYYFLRPVLTVKNSLESAIAKDVNDDNSSLLINETNIIINDFETDFNPEEKKENGSKPHFFTKDRLRTETDRASNSFLSGFCDFVYNKLSEGLEDCLGELIASNADKWITIHPHGKSEDGENDYRRLLIKEGETVEEAMHRQGYYDKRKANDELKKKVEEKIKTLEEKAKKVGGDQTVLGRKYLAEAEALRKGLKDNGEEKKPEEKKETKTNQSLLPRYASDFIEKTQKQKEAREKWHKLLIEYQDKAKTDNKMLEFERKREEIQNKMREIKTYNQEFQQLINEKNKIIDAKRAYEKEFFKEVYAAQKEYSDLDTTTEKKDIIKKMSSDIKTQISKISTNHNELIKSINKIDFSVFDKLKKQDEEFEKEQDSIYGKMREIGREFGYNDPRITEYRAKVQEYAVKRGEIKKQQKELQYKNAVEIGKLLQVKNGVKLDTKNSPAMQDITDKLKECLDGVIPSTNFNNAKMTVKKHEGRAYQSGSTINISANEEIGTAIHETMHHLEEHSEHVLMNSLAFATSRTEGEKQESLRRLTGLNYKASEVCKKDKFFNPYCGKLYDEFGGRNKTFVSSHASEIMSMGVQKLFTNPQEFAKEDREYFDFVVANLKGELWN